MPYLKIKDNAKTYLNSDLVQGAIIATVVDGSSLPDGSDGNFILTCESEKMLCSSRSGNTITILTRGYGGTTDTNHSAGKKIYLGSLEHSIKELQDAIDNHDHIGGNGAPISEAGLSLSDNQTGNVSASKHGFTPKAPNDATKFLDGTANWKKPKATELDPIGLSSSQLIRVKSDGTQIESSGKEAPSGDIVGTSDTQTLTNKTLTKPVLEGSVPKVRSYTPGAGGTATLDLSDCNIHVITMPAGNITIALSNVSVGQVFLVEIVQDSVGNRTVTWFTTIKWAEGGTAPTLTTTANKKDTFIFRCTSLSNYDGYVAGQNI